MFNSAENSKIKSTSFWYSTNGGTTWLNVPDSSYIDTSPDGQTINGTFIAWNIPYLNVVGT